MSNWILEAENDVLRARLKEDKMMARQILDIMSNIRMNVEARTEIKERLMFIINGE